MCLLFDILSSPFFRTNHTHLCAETGEQVGTTNYLYDGSAITEGLDNSGDLLVRYAPGASVDQPLAMLRSGTTSYYQADGIGSVTSLSSGAAAIENTYSYDSFGNSSGSTGTLTNPFQYTGRELDAETNIYLYRLRYYDSSTGRFLNEDPIAFQGGVNFYVYVKNSPTRFIDPTGLVGIEPATSQQVDAVLGLFPGSSYAGGTINVPGMSCLEVEKILEQSGYSTANNTPTSWFSSLVLFHSPVHNGINVHRHGGLHFVLQDNPGKDCDSGSCTITDFHNDPNDPLDHPIRHVIMDAIPWYLGTHPIQITHGH